MPVPEVFAVGAFGERQTIVMEYCPGPTLGMPLREQPRRAEVCLAELVAVQRRVHACSVPGLEPLQARLERKLQAAPLTPPFEPCITGGPKLCPAPLAFAMGIAGPLTSSKRKPLPSSSTGRRLRWSPCVDACCSYPLFCARSGAGRGRFAPLWPSRRPAPLRLPPPVVRRGRGPASRNPRRCRG